MTELTHNDREVLLREYDLLRGQQMDYYRSILATERLAVAGAAAVIAFLYTKLPNFALGQSEIISAVPAAIIMLAGLRCLSIYIVMKKVSKYLERCEAALLDADAFGFQRSFTKPSALPMRVIEVTTTLFWTVATIACIYFWTVYEPVAAIPAGE